MYSPIAKLMQRFGAAPTRENYLKFAFLGKPPADTTELEDTMPERFRLPVREYDKLDATAIPSADPENLTNAKETYDAVRGMSKHLSNPTGVQPTWDTERAPQKGVSMAIYHGRTTPGPGQKATRTQPAKTPYPMDTTNPPKSSIIPDGVKVTEN